MPRRPVESDLPEPERASDAVIARCRSEIEGRMKRRVRALIVPLLRRRWRLAELGEGFHWPRGGRLSLARGSRIGRYAYLGEGFESMGPVVVGDLCMISAGCRIVGADHLYDQPGTPTRLAFPDGARPVTVFGLDVWLGRDVMVKEGAHIGAGAVVASGSVVTGDIAPYTVVGGVPARLIRVRFEGDAAAQHDGEVRANAAVAGERIA